MADILVLLSGGMDSATLLWEAKTKFDNVYAISFDYGQKHVVELKYAKILGEMAKVKEHFVVKIPHYKEIKFNSALLSGSNQDIPKEAYPTDVPITYVPMRNLTFLAIASGIADEVGIENIGIAVHAVDAPYPDCRPEFISSAEAAINAGSSFVVKTKKRIHVYAPFLGFSKKDIAILGKSLGVPFDKTYSCYEGTEPPCGKCATCIQRKEALDGVL
ncbi:7-cyano-7-deazaguanine synthase QueC [Hydrogenobaculum acidophilum]